MKKNTKVLITTLYIGLMGLLQSQAVATQIGASIGEYSDGGGGEFTIYNIDPATGIDISEYEVGVTANVYGASPSIQTFCIELNRSFRLGETIDVDIQPFATSGGVSGQNAMGVDPVSRGTAYIYSVFAEGEADTLWGYDYTPSPAGGRISSAAELQQAIWALENEYDDPSTSFVADPYDYISGDLLTAIEDKFGDLATAMLNQGLSDGVDYFGVSALNITKSGTTRDRQDQLYYHGYSKILAIPDTGSMLTLLGLAFGIVGFFQKRLNK